MNEMIYLVGDFNTAINDIAQDNDFEGCNLTEDGITKALTSFNGDVAAASIFLKKYAVRNEANQIIEFTLDEAKDRWARAISSAELRFNGKNHKAEYFRGLYEYFLPAGRQMLALGNEYLKKATFTNCYVTKIEEDSIEGIYDAAKRCARTYSYGGGIGLCIGELRPSDSLVSNSAKFSTGAVSFMELYSHTTGLIGQQGRRGALMITIPVNHPDILKFIEMKHNDEERVKFANISIKLTDEFMRAVENDDDFVLGFKTVHENIVRTIKARFLWDKIITSARDSGEPGLLFWDRMVELSPSDCYPRLKVHATNPCGEQILEPGGACVLGSLLLHKFVIDPFTNNARFDEETFCDMVSRGVRHLDNVVELNRGKHPLVEQDEAAMLGRRIGLGVTGLADMFAALQIRYDSDQALEVADHVMNLKKNSEYSASINLAKERGSFVLYDPHVHFTRGFAATLPEEIINNAKINGLRNVAISTIAPNGSLSIIAQCSGGAEPIFALHYTRNVMLGKEEKKEFSIYHQGITRFFDVAGEQDLPDYWVTAHNIDDKYRVKLQGVLQKHIDASISSTINLPKNTDAATVGRIYFNAWKEGLKGITVYREGSRKGVLITDEYAKSIGIPNMNTSIHCVRAEGGDKFYIMVSYENRDITKPYQVFVMNYKKSDSDAFVKISNSLIKMLREKGAPEERITKYINRSHNSLVKLTRFLSLSMKTDNLQNALKILDEHAFAGTLASKLYDILSKSVQADKACCPNCGSTNLKTEEACISCLDCNWSKCH